LTPKKFKEAGLIISVPLELAREIFVESGDLPSTKFPAIMILADTIGKALPQTPEDAKKRSMPIIIAKTRKAKSAHDRKPLENYMLTK
jgi:hypothetical protein